VEPDADARVQPTTSRRPATRFGGPGPSYDDRLFPKREVAMPHDDAMRVVAGSSSDPSSTDTQGLFLFRASQAPIVPRWRSLHRLLPPRPSVR
jgi:hypothetical protein